MTKSKPIFIVLFVGYIVIAVLNALYRESGLHLHGYHLAEFDTKPRKIETCAFAV